MHLHCVARGHRRGNDMGRGRLVALTAIQQEILVAPSVNLLKLGLAGTVVDSVGLLRALLCWRQTRCILHEELLVLVARERHIGSGSLLLLHWNG